MNPQTCIAHYRIRTKLGEGGMGEVYRATDTKLGRDVALKVLPPNVAGDPDRLARFQREARAVAALNHPNIVTLYSVEESDGVHFITMELVEGKPLDSLISADGLGVERIIEIAGALAEALVAAHDKGIVHRDLKPANVMVTEDGRVKVLDFGLAKDVGATAAGDATVTSAGHTQAGVVMGTPAYMSPEQIAGRPLDYRTDIFSLGVLLYEMATGKRPFQGTSSAELMSSVLRDTPPLVTDVRPELPADLARVTRRCLEKDPRYRVQTARDVVNEFRDLARIAPRPGSVSTSVSRTMAGSDSAAARANEGFWVAVLPFHAKGADEAVHVLADGLTDEIITGLSRFSYLRVIARGSTAKYSGESGDVRAIGKELGAHYVLEGNVRHAGSTIRVAVQLVEATTGAHVWAETFERPFHPDEIFALQDQLVPRIVSTVADQHGILPRSISAAIRRKSDHQLSPYEAIFRIFGLHENMTPQEHAACRDLLERVVQDAPDAHDCWALLATLYADEVWFEFNVRPDPLGREAAAAQRALELAPASALASQALAQSLFVRHEWQAFRPVAERTIALNPMDGATVAIMGLMLACSGQWERGCAVADAAMRLNPNFPGWYWLTTVFNAYRTRDYRAAIDAALRIQMPGYFWTSLACAAAHGQLGESPAAQKALNELLAGRPNFAGIARRELAKWFDTELVEHFLEGLGKAGLEIGLEKDRTPTKSSASEAPAEMLSGETPSAEGFWVAVAPFKFIGASVELAALAEGLTEEIIAGLSRFTYLRVLTKGTAGARYILEGSLRQAGAQLRVAVKLIDTTTGAHLWAENFERTFAPDRIFDLQDELVPRIVSTVADAYGVLPHSMSHAVRGKPIEELTPYQGLLRSFSYAERVTAEEHALAKSALERAVEQAPLSSDCWAMLSILLVDGYIHGFDAQPDSLDHALEAARRAVDTGPSNHKAHQSLGWALFFRKDFKASRVAAERTIALNPMDACATVYMAQTIALGGDWERGCPLILRAMDLNPNHPGWYWYCPFLDAYRKSDYRAALDIAIRINMPGFPLASVALAATFAQLGELDAARSALRELLAMRPDYPKSAQAELEKIMQPQLAAHMVEGLRKAGLFDREPASQSQATAATTDSGTNRAQEGFWIAVLPFRASSAEIQPLADGIFEEVSTAFSRFSYLRVVSRGSALRYAGQAPDLRIAGKELGAHYVMEGSLRQGGARLRASIGLTDADTGIQLWAETYERPFHAESIFEIQDDLVPRIVSTCADPYGVLARNISDSVRGKAAHELTPYEALLRGFGYHQRLVPEEHLRARDALEHAVEKDPGNSDCWAMLAWVYAHEHGHGFNPRPRSLDRSLQAARRAVDLNPANHLAHQALSTALFFRKDLAACLYEADRAIELNPVDGGSNAAMGAMIAFAGDWDRGIGLIQRAMELNDQYPFWCRSMQGFNEFRQGNYEAALTALVKSNAPEVFWTQMFLAATHAHLQDNVAASRSVQHLIRLRPDFNSLDAVEEHLDKWFQRDVTDRVLDGMQKAGLKPASGK